MAVGQRMVQMAEVPDAKPGHLEDEDRIAVRDHLRVGVAAIEHVAADVGRHVADKHVADGEGVPGRGAVVVPAVQYMLDARVGMQRVVSSMGAVHGDDVGHAAGVVDAVVVGRDANAARRLDHIGRMAGIGDADLIAGRDVQVRVDDMRQRLSERETLAGLRRIGCAG